MTAGAVPGAVSLRGLTKTFPGGATAAVSDLTLELAPASLTALLGPSGCGKTTTLELIAGLLAPDAGDVRFGDVSVLRRPPERRPVAMVFQKALLFPHLDVAGNVAFGLRMRHVPRRERRARVDDVLSLVRLDGFGGRGVDELSGGQEQRVALARALVTEPRVLLLDEPFSALDPELRGQMRTLLRDVQRTLGVTTLFVTHDRAEAVEVADSVALLLAGRLAQHGTGRDLYERPASAAVARFFGATNLIPGVRSGHRFTTAFGPVTVGPGGPDGPGVLVVRPESLRLTEAGDADAVPVTVTAADYRGTHTVVTAVAGEVTLVVHAAAGAVVPVGAPAGLHIPAHSTRVVAPG